MVTLTNKITVTLRVDIPALFDIRDNTMQYLSNSVTNITLLV